jgi:hypothetical protein
MSHATDWEQKVLIGGDYGGNEMSNFRVLSVQKSSLTLRIIFEPASGVLQEQEDPSP